MTILTYLCDSLLMSQSDIVKYALSSPHRYKIYRISKRNSNQKRVIAHPASELKFIQRLLIQYLEPKFQLHGCAFAYRKNLSVKDNAKMHLNTRYLLKMDFKNFFPSITPKLLFDSLKSAGLFFDNDDKQLMSGLLFCKYIRSGPLVLSIGAPSSPLISNFVMFNFDEFIHSECTTIVVNYTRYADDITFSSNEKNVLFSVPEIVEKALKSYFDGIIKLNPGKTVFSSRAHNRHVTGVTLTNNDKLSVGRARKRLISAMIHRFVIGNLTDKEIKSLQGHFSYVVHIESDFYDRMSLKYGQENIVKITKYQFTKT